MFFSGSLQFYYFFNRVELWREPSKSLGISIVGGRGMGSRLSNGEVMRGIFIKHVLEDSPAGKNGTLKPGDRIVEVTSRELSIQNLFPHSLSYLRSCHPSPCVSQTFVMARISFFLSRFFFFLDVMTNYVCHVKTSA